MKYLMMSNSGPLTKLFCQTSDIVVTEPRSMYILQGLFQLSLQKTRPSSLDVATKDFTGPRQTRRYYSKPNLGVMKSESGVETPRSSMVQTESKYMAELDLHNSLGFRRFLPSGGNCRNSISRRFLVVALQFFEFGQIKLVDLELGFGGFLEHNIIILKKTRSMIFKVLLWVKTWPIYTQFSIRVNYSIWVDIVCEFELFLRDII